MKKSISKKKNYIPSFLVPKMRKRHVLPLYSDHKIEWKLFAEGALRNKVFHDDVINRGNKCLACNRHFNHEHAAVSSKIDKHHHCYVRLCRGNILPEGSEDIYRPARNTEFPHVPNCRTCKTENPEYYEGCIKKIFPVHHQCHGRIHEVEKFRFNKLGKKLLSSFRSVSLPQT